MSKTNPLRDKINLRLQLILEATKKMLAIIKRSKPHRVVHESPGLKVTVTDGVCHEYGTKVQVVDGKARWER